MKKKTKEKQTKIVHVIWEDCVGDGSGWIDREEFDDWADTELPEIHTVGFLVAEREKFIMVASCVSSDDGHSFGNVQKIPRSQIHSVETLAELPIDLGEEEPA